MALPYCDCGFIAEETISQFWALSIVQGATNWLGYGAILFGAIAAGLSATMLGYQGLPRAWRWIGGARPLSWLRASCCTSSATRRPGTWPPPLHPASCCRPGQSSSRCAPNGSTWIRPEPPDAAVLGAVLIAAVACGACDAAPIRPAGHPGADRLVSVIGWFRSRRRSDRVGGSPAWLPTSAGAGAWTARDRATSRGGCRARRGRAG